MALEFLCVLCEWPSCDGQRCCQSRPGAQDCWAEFLDLDAGNSWITKNKFIALIFVLEKLS